MISLKASRIRVMVEIEKVVANKPFDIMVAAKTLAAQRDAHREAHREASRICACSGTYSVYSEFNSRPVYKVNFNVEIT